VCSSDLKDRNYLDKFVSFLNLGYKQVVIIPTQNFSLGFKGHKKVEVKYLPILTQLMLGRFGKEIMVILDESSWIKSSSATKSSFSIRSKMIMYLGEMVKYKFIATGTEMTKSPMNLYNQYKFLDKNYWGELESDFFRRYTITKRYYFGRNRETVTAISKKDYDDIKRVLRGNFGLSKFNNGKDAKLDDSKLSRMAHKHNISMYDADIIADNDKYYPYRDLNLLAERISNVTYKVKREDIFDIAHDKFVYEPIVREVELSEEQKKIYQKLVKTGFTDDFYLGKAAALELLIRCQDICNGQRPIKDDTGAVYHQAFKENPKMDALMDLIQEIDEDEQIVVWSSRILMIDTIKERLEKEGITYGEYTGQQTSKEKLQTEEAFKAKSIRVFIGNPAAAGFGLNALRDCNYMVWMCINDSVEQYHQAQHRILRGESKTPKFAYAITCKGTVEERQFERIKLGEELLRNENSAEVFEYVR
jgi:hypothetical protein